MESIFKIFTKKGKKIKNFREKICKKFRWNFLKNCHQKRNKNQKIPRKGKKILVKFFTKLKIKLVSKKKCENKFLLDNFFKIVIKKKKIFGGNIFQNFHKKERNCLKFPEKNWEKISDGKFFQNFRKRKKLKIFQEKNSRKNFDGKFF